MKSCKSNPKNMIQRLINEIRFPVLALILTCFFDAHTIYASSDFCTYHIFPTIVERIDHQQSK